MKIKITKKRKTLSYKEDLIESLKDPQEAIAYLNAALMDEDSRIFLVALRDVIEAHSGMTKISKQSNLNRQNLYRMLSKKGNPGIVAISKILDSMGIKLATQLKNGK